MLEKFVHYSDGFLVRLLELGVEHIDNILDRLVSNNRLEGSPAKMCTALGATLPVSILTEMFEYATLAEGVEALVDGVSITVETRANGALEIDMQVRLFDRLDQLSLLLHWIEFICSLLLLLLDLLGALIILFFNQRIN